MTDNKPICKLSDADGNIFNLIGIASRCLRKEGMGDKANEMKNKIFRDSHSYDEALQIIMEYVEVE